jgi:hypothetical protein
VTSYPVGSAVKVRYPLTPDQPRAEWPWLPGSVMEQVGPDECVIALIDRRVAVTEHGTAPSPDTPDEELWFPTCFRDSEELRPTSDG